MTKILFIGSTEMGGSGLVSVDLANYMSESSKNEVHYLGFDNTYFNLSKKVFFHKVDEINYSLFSFRMMELSLINKALKIDDLYSFDIIHVHYGLIFSSPIPFLNKRGRKIILTFHGSDVLGWNSDFSSLSEVKEYITTIVSFCNVITFASKSLSEKFFNNFDNSIKSIESRKKAVIVSNCTTVKKCFNSNFVPETIELNLKKINNKFLIFHASNFRRVKQTDLIIDILLNKKIEKENLMFVLAGDGETMNNFKKKVVEFNLQDKVLFLGKISLEDTQKWIKRSNTSLIMSHYENSSLFIIDSLFLERPVIASNVGGNGELIENGVTGILVDDYKKQGGYIMAILDIINKEKIFPSSNFINFKKSFNRDSIYEIYNSVYNETLK